MSTRSAHARSVAGALAALLAVGLAGSANAETDRIAIDYAYYNPVSLLLKEKGWLEEEFAAEDIDIAWVLSLGSNKALEFLRGGSVDFGSTAGGAALLGRANGNPINAVYIYSQPEWTALVTRPDTGIDSVDDLAGRRVAVTRGTDPHLFLLRALNEAGLSEDDLEVVLLQHPDGARALVQGSVDAWAGLDPHMAQVELENDAILFYRNTDFNSYGVLNVREDFAEENPELTERVLEVYERGRRYALENPDEVRDILIAATRLDEAVAERQLSERTLYPDPVIGEGHAVNWQAVGETLQEIGLIRPDADIAALVDDLIDSSYAERAVERQQAQR
ncbi:aliphatic sulfonate ABC transporter substrate-binding protein [Inquilinus sp. CAU 1745]|uniref:aliphatic sulfonate ABC transporter substrate-binding protein n=1 Tax=Inquilinus sp. CAU 1745 TaxID=3140369 RepID=UPI00325B83BA